MSSIFVNKKLTYLAIMENEFFFKEVMDYMSRNEELKNTNKIPKTVYEDMLKVYIDKKYKNDNFEVMLGGKAELALSPENLTHHELMAVASGVLYGGDLLLIANHVIQMLKNIFKEYAQALSRVEYDDLAMVLREKRKYLETHPSLSVKSVELKEMIASMEMVMIRAEESIISSIGALNYRKQNISLSAADDGKASKYKVAKELYEKFINPLYHFVSPKNSLFMAELVLISEFLSEKSNLYYLKRKVDFYSKQFLLHSKDIQPIRQYIAGYIRQTEIELEMNLGSERMFNELMEILEKYKVGNRNIKYELFRGAEELEKINNPFRRAMASASSRNIKHSPNTAESFRKIEQYLIETIGRQKEKKVSKKINRDLSAVVLKKREDDRLRRFIHLDMVVKCRSQIELSLEKKKKIEITAVVKKFIEASQVLGIGEFEYIIMSIVKEAGDKYVFTMGEWEMFTAKGRFAKYRKIEIRQGK